MDILQLIRAAAGVADSVAQGPEDTPNVVWRTFGPWVTRLLTAAAQKWLPRLAANIPCEIPMPGIGSRPGGPCQNLAVSACDVCHRPVCLAHARVDYAGDAICLECVARAVQEARARDAARPPPPPPEDGPRRPPPRPINREQLRQAYEVLGCTPRDSDEQLKQACRKRSAKWHPDRHPDDPARAERKFKKVQQAYETVLEARRRAA